METAVILLYSYPSIVTLASVFLLNERLTPAKAIALPISSSETSRMSWTRCSIRSWKSSPRPGRSCAALFQSKVSVALIPAPAQPDSLPASLRRWLPITFLWIWFVPS